MSSLKVYDDVHGGYGFCIRNMEGVALLDFSHAFGLVVFNSNFPNKEVTKIKFLLLRKRDRGFVRIVRCY